MLVSALSPLLVAGFAAGFVLPESLRAHKIDIDSLYPNSFKGIGQVIQHSEAVFDGLIHPHEPVTEEKTVYELVAANPE